MDHTSGTLSVTSGSGKVSEWELVRGKKGLEAGDGLGETDSAERTTCAEYKRSVARPHRWEHRRAAGAQKVKRSRQTGQPGHPRPCHHVKLLIILKSVAAY